MTQAVILILTDNVSKGRHIAGGLERLNGRIVIQDVAGSERGPLLDAGQAVIVSDISFSKPGSISAIRSELDRLKRVARAHICLIRHETLRDRAQANALGATRVVCVEHGLQSLRAAIAPLLTTSKNACSFPGLVDKAGDAFENMMLAAAGGQPVSPAMVEAGASLILAALGDAAVRDWLDRVQLFDDRTHRHCLLVAGLAAAFALQLGFNANDARRLTRGALLHDVGKSRIPVEILNKPSRLDKDERAIIETHPVVGWELLMGQGHDAEALTMVRSHHEMLDGSGYPDGLKGPDISDIVRMLTICDIFAALIEVRPYKAAMKAGDAFAILENMSAAKKLDSILVRTFKPLASACEPLKAAS